MSGLGSLKYCNATGQKVSLTLTGSGSSYTTAIELNNPSDLTSGLSYAGGVLTSNSAAIATSSFTVATGKDGHELSGTLTLTYQTDGTPLTFSDNAAYDIPASTVNSAITTINVAPGVSGGTTPYTFSATGLPAGITISTVGVISGTPTTAADAGTATITVTDSAAPTATGSITINYGAVSTAPSIGTDITAKFTDPNFLAAVRTAVGKGVSESVYDKDVASVSSLGVSSKNIASLAGIEYFTALNGLYCYNNQLTALDVSSNTALTTLYCSDNQLTALDVSKNTALTTLDCYNNQLTALDVSKNAALEWLYCYNNQLTALGVSKNTALITLDCSNNQLTALDVSKNTTLTWLDCSNNQLTALDVNKNTALEWLYCYNNQLTALGVSKNTALTDLDCSDNQLTALDLSGLCSLTSCTANDQRVSLTLSLTGSGNSYTKTITLNNPTNLISGLSYAGGVLTSNSTAIDTSSFTVDTGNASYKLSGTLELTYQTEANITLNANGGNALTPGTLTTGADGRLTSLPTPTRSDYRFDGWFTAKNGGTKVTTETVFTVNTTIYAYWTYTPWYPVSGVTLDKSSLTLEVNGPAQKLAATVQPSYASYPYVYWNSSDTEVARVDNTGLVTPVAPGQAIITATTSEGGKTASCTVEVLARIEGIKLNKASTTITEGNSETLKATLIPENSKQNISWSSDDSSIATVDSEGLVTGISPGTTFITVRTVEGDFSANCTVTVMATITATAEETIVLHDEPVSINIPPEVEATIEVTPGSTMPQVNINSSTALGTVEIQIPEGTIASSPDDWDGTLKLPTISSQPSVNINGASQVNMVIVLGLEDEQISFSQAVRILIPGQAQQQVGYIRNGVFTPITRILSADRQDVADSEIPADGDGKIDVGSDLVVWTKHFTEFVTYTPISNPEPVSCTVSLSSNYAKAGTVSGDGTFYGGSLITVRAQAQSGYVFDNWSENGCMLSRDSVYSFNLGNSSRQLQANFVREFQEISITDATKPRIITFSHPVLPGEQNLGNIYVATDINGDNKVEGVIVVGVSGNNCQISVKPPGGQWLAGASYYLILEPGLQSALNKTLGIRTRMKFTVE